MSRAAKLAGQGTQLLYTSSLDRTRTIGHDVERTEAGTLTQLVVTTTGLELELDRKGNVRLLTAGDGRQMNAVLVGRGGVIG